MKMVTAPRTLDTMAPHARVWVYKTEKLFSPEQRAAIIERGAKFTSGWAAHGSALDACVDVLHDRFVVIAVDEQQAMASGCSIDKSVHFVKALEQDLGLVLTDRMVVLFERDGAVTSCRVPEVQGLLAQGLLTPDTLVFDDLVSTKADLDRRFKTPLRTTWLARYC